MSTWIHTLVFNRVRCAKALVFYVVFSNHCPFSYSHCIVCPPICGFFLLFLVSWNLTNCIANQMCIQVKVVFRFTYTRTLKTYYIIFIMVEIICTYIIQLINLCGINSSEYGSELTWPDQLQRLRSDQVTESNKPRILISC